MSTPTDPAARGRPFRTARDGAPGVSRGELRTARYRAITRGVHVPARVPDVLVTRLAGLDLILPGPWMAVGRTAALLWRLPLPEPGSDRPAAGRPAAPPLDIAVARRAGRRPRRLGVRVRQVAWHPGDVRVIAGVPTAAPARTFADLAADLQLADLVAVGDAVLRRRLASPDELAAVVAAMGRRRGVRRARTALGLLDPRAESPQESRVRVVLVTGGLPAPEVNADIYDDAGQWLARGDLVYRAARVVVEYDGTVHAGERQRRRDAARRTLLRAHGWYVVELTADDLRYPWRAVAKVRAALASRA